jgi:SAM-dependent methyltransferase
VITACGTARTAKPASVEVVRRCCAPSRITHHAAATDGPELSRAFGREAFGADPAAYDAVRPGYPTWVFDELVARGALRPGAATFEIGAGTGIATRALLARGAGPLVAIEPDPRLSAFLRTRRLAADVREQPFEDCALGDAAFDLGFCATAFVWASSWSGGLIGGVDPRARPRITSCSPR